MAKKLFGLSEKDVKRLEAMLNWFEKTNHNPPPPPRTRRPPSFGGGKLFIAKVVSDATGGGYYNCYLQTINTIYWDTNTLALTNAEAVPVPIVVLNLAEIGSNVHNLAANKYIWGFIEIDSAGNRRHIGLEVFGRHTFGEIT